MIDGERPRRPSASRRWRRPPRRNVHEDDYAVRRASHPCGERRREAIGGEIDVLKSGRTFRRRAPSCRASVPCRSIAGILQFSWSPASPQTAQAALAAASLPFEIGRDRRDRIEIIRHALRIAHLMEKSDSRTRTSSRMPVDPSHRSRAANRIAELRDVPLKRKFSSMKGADAPQDIVHCHSPDLAHSLVLRG